MSRSTFIADHINLAMTKPWHGPSLKGLLSDVTAEEARAHPIPGAHSIAELAAHIGVWVHVVELRVRGIATEPTEAEQWAPLDTSSDSAWRAAAKELTDAHTELSIAVRALSNERLIAPVVGREYDIGTMLHGVIEHAAYHGGQIAMLKKMMRAH